MSKTTGDAIYRIQRQLGGMSEEDLATVERFISSMTLLSSKGDVVTELIDRYEKHKASVQQQSDLKIGPNTIACDYSEGILMLNYLRDRLLADAR